MPAAMSQTARREESVPSRRPVRRRRRGLWLAAALAALGLFAFASADITGLGALWRGAFARTTPLASSTSAGATRPAGDDAGAPPAAPAPPLPVGLALRRDPRCARASINAVDISADGRLLAAASDDGTVTLHALTHEAPPRTLHGPAVPLLDVAWLAPDASRLVTCGGIPSGDAPGTLLFLSPDEVGARRDGLGHESPILAVAATPDGLLAASAGGRLSPFGEGNDHDVRLWNADGTLRARLSGHGAAVTTLAFSADGRWLASGSVDGLVLVRRVPSGRDESAQAAPALRLQHGQPVIVARFSPDGERLATGGGNVLLGGEGRVLLWRLDDGARLAELSGHGSPIFGLAFAPDGRWLASCSGAPLGVLRAPEASLRLWDAHAGTELHVERPQLGTLDAEGARQDADGLWSLDVSPDGRLLVAGADDGRVLVYEVLPGAR